jgi:hypothetical protein
MKRKDKINEVKILQAKRADTGLTELEEKRYCKLNSELSGYPEQVFTKEYNDKLDDVISTTDKLIALWSKK